MPTLLFFSYPVNLNVVEVFLVKSNIKKSPTVLLLRI
jgi:hypothetical protein